MTAATVHAGSLPVFLRIGNTQVGETEIGSVPVVGDAVGDAGHDELVIRVWLDNEALAELLHAAADAVAETSPHCL